MKTIENIITIINDMNDIDFERACKADDDRVSLDRRLRKNGTKRLMYTLKKYDLTKEEWIEWCNL